jgi:hypothetical protein
LKSLYELQNFKDGLESNEKAQPFVTIKHQSQTVTEVNEKLGKSPEINSLVFVRQNEGDCL